MWRKSTFNEFVVNSATLTFCSVTTTINELHLTMPGEEFSSPILLRRFTWKEFHYLLTFIIL